MRSPRWQRREGQSYVQHIGGQLGLELATVDLGKENIEDILVLEEGGAQMFYT